MNKQIETEISAEEVPAQLAYPSIKQGWGMLGYFILITLLYSIPLGVIQLSGIDIQHGFYLLMNYSIPMILLIWLLRFFWKKNPENGRFLSLKPFPLIILPMVVLMTLSFIWINSEITSWVPMPSFLENLFKEMMEPNIWGFLTVAVAAPILEETLLRGIVLEGLLKNYNPKKAIIWSALFFGILHLNPWQFVAAFIVALGIGYLYWRTRSLWLCIFIHFLNNATAFLIYFLYPDTTDTADLFEIGTINRVLIFGLAIFILWLVYRYFENYFKSSTAESASKI
ncbi:CPBP family intramembrane glutamic endopeptidase [Ancylomarina longa]|uniref:CPBP family intramembrane metalloprotease n=1 Tax=Ancylomarina longa TaxID=2487017 RepID=A0A434AXY9_9BACT|nr:type II CAAX endopeptidase family protein [Ancylomarina longa]RUT79384.1 CPBP family intramembrane metalloprotease [Ancylomarina longa]